jgi:TatD DNase family protein
MHDRFFGKYRTKKWHNPDLNQVITRANSFGVHGMLVIGRNLKEAENALSFAMTKANVYCSIGLHPISSADIFQYTAITKKNF